MVFCDDEVLITVRPSPLPYALALMKDLVIVAIVSALLLFLLAARSPSQIVMVVNVTLLVCCVFIPIAFVYFYFLGCGVCYVITRSQIVYKKDGRTIFLIDIADLTSVTTRALGMGYGSVYFTCDWRRRSRDWQRRDRRSIQRDWVPIGTLLAVKHAAKTKTKVLRCKRQYCGAFSIKILRSQFQRPFHGIVEYKRLADLVFEIRTSIDPEYGALEQ